MIIFIFGDSITQGYWDTEGGWADRIKVYVLTRDIDQDFKYYHGVHNLGIDGNTIQQVIDRFKSEVDARLWPNSEYGFIFAIGTNDTMHRNGINTATNPSKYNAQIKELSTLASQYSLNIAFVNLPPVDEALTNPLPVSSTGKCYTNDQIDLFNKQLELACAELTLNIIDIRKPYLEKGYKTHLADGLHPNHDGHTLIFDAVLPTITSWLYK